MCHRIEVSLVTFCKQGAQWLSGRVLDSRPKGNGFKPHRRHCVLSLSEIIYPTVVLVQPRKTSPYITERLLMGRKESNQTKQFANEICISIPEIGFVSTNSEDPDEI